MRAAVFGVWSASHAASQPAKTLYSFQGGSDGGGPQAGLVIGKDGVLYGTANHGGTANLGVVFQLTPPTLLGAPWTETVLHSFTGQPDGAYPASSLIFSHGDLYGVTFYGGVYGAGSVFQLTPAAIPGGTWTDNVIYSFTGGSDGNTPVGTLVDGQNGEFYGATQLGGVTCPLAGGCGVVFELAPVASSGAWIETVLYSFTGGDDGAQPASNVVLGSGGALYGTTDFGGAFADGTVFRLSPPSVAGGSWTEAVLHGFNSRNGEGANPQAPLLIAGNGAVFGTTGDGGFSPRSCYAGCGVVFELTPSVSGSGEWTETVLHSFTGYPNDGALPVSALLLGENGTLYGTTGEGGSVLCPPGRFGLPGCGVVFELAPGPDSGHWVETIRHNFMAGQDGAHPFAGLTVGTHGILFGTTSSAGTKNQACVNGCGTVFALGR